MFLLKIDKNLDKQQSDNEQDKHKNGDESSQQTLLFDKGIVDNSQLRVCLDRTYFAETENWKLKHCSKIIFKCVNSNVGPNFNEKVT